MRRPGRRGGDPGRPGSAGSARPGVFPIDSGTAELVQDRDRPRGFLLLVNGAESSHADLDDPSWLEFEYLRWMAVVIARHQSSVPGLRVVHLGAAGCSLARHLLAVRPDSRHLAVDIDARLADLVREWFALPRSPALRIRIGDARQVLGALPTGSADVVVRDVFAGTVTPAELTTLESTREVRRVLAPGGLYLLNCADGADLAVARSEAATLAAVFAHTAAIADPPMLKGRRRGNLVMAGAATPIASAELAGDLRGGPAPAGVWGDAETAGFARGVPILRDGPPTSAPETLLRFLQTRRRGSTFTQAREPGSPPAGKVDLRSSD